MSCREKGWRLVEVMDGARVRVRELRADDARAAAELHHRHLPEQFLAHAGPRFLARYHRAFRAPHGLALIAEDGGGRVVGLLLCSTNARAFYADLPRRDGPALSAALALAALASPRFGLEVVRTRLPRYLRWLRRRLSATPTPPTAVPTSADVVGEVTVVVVDPRARGLGAGRALLDEAARRAAAAGALALELVTGPDDPAAAFYAHLSWQPGPLVTSASGERFRKYRLTLPG